MHSWYSESSSSTSSSRGGLAAEKVIDRRGRASTGSSAGVGSVGVAVGGHGSQGASVHSRVHGQWRVPAVAVQTRDTVGAGDTFQAALLAYLARHDLDSPSGLADISREQLDAMLRLAVGAAALTCSRVGPDLPHWHELEAF